MLCLNNFFILHVCPVIEFSCCMCPMVVLFSLVSSAKPLYNTWEAFLASCFSWIIRYCANSKSVFTLLCCLLIFARTYFRRILIVLLLPLQSFPIIGVKIRFTSCRKVVWYIIKRLDGQQNKSNVSWVPNIFYSYIKWISPIFRSWPCYVNHKIMHSLS